MEIRMQEIYDVIIVGGGPAGLTASIYGKRAGLRVLLIEKNSVCGGQIITTEQVDNYPGFFEIGGYELGNRFSEQAEKLGLLIKTGEVSRVSLNGLIKKIHIGDVTYEGKTVILSCGTNIRKLHVTGEDEYTGRGVSYCATCDGAFFRDRIVAVVGGGNTAVEDVIYLARSCKKVYLIHRGMELRADKTSVEKMSALNNVEIIWNHTIEKIDGEAFVTNVTIKNVKTSKQKKIAVSGVFIAIGRIPNTQICESEIRLDEKGYIIANEDGKTSCEGVFAAGDIRTKPLRQVVTAVADGANSITSVEYYLRKVSPK